MRIVTILLALSICSPVLAEDRDELAKILPDYDIWHLTVVEDWAQMAVTRLKEPREDGSALARKLDGQWQVVVVGGGAFGPTIMHHVGVPRRYWLPLIGWSERPEGIEALSSETFIRALEGEPFFVSAPDQRYKRDETQRWSEWILTIKRCYILARHGKIFDDTYVREYFMQRDWYKPDAAFTEDRLTEVDKANVELILEVQRERGDRIRN